MGVLTRAKKRKLEEVDHISGLPDGVLGDIVSLLPTRDGARTQLLSSRWRHLWRSAPLNVDLNFQRWTLRRPIRVNVNDLSRILSAHRGPSRRFSVHVDNAAAEFLDGWLRSPAVDSLQELEIHFDAYLLRCGTPPLPLPASTLRFSSTLCAASFEACVLPLLPDENNGGDGRGLQWPLLKQLTLSHVTISESSLLALLTGCNALESLLLHKNKGFHQVKIVSGSLRSIGVGSTWGHYEDRDPRLQQLVIEDAPCLERLLVFEGMEISVSVISAPRLSILGKLYGDRNMIQFGTSRLEGSTVASLTAVVPSVVRVLALSNVNPYLVINLMKFFPHLEKLHVKITDYAEPQASYDEQWRRQHFKVGYSHVT